MRASLGRVNAAKRLVFATAGHVDHGKTSLMRRLTGVDTDRLPDEKRRGISIELGFAELPESAISFIDVPGHRRLVHQMIAGVGGVDAVLLVVAADDGVMPQTREHLQICRLLGIRRILVALTKGDLVDEETLDLAEMDVQSSLDSIGLEPVEIVRTSSLTGAGVADLDGALRSLATSIPERAGPGRGAKSDRVWMPIDRVFTIKGAGTVVTGTLTRGSLALGSPVFVAGRGVSQNTACRSLEVHGRSVEAVSAPSRVAVNLGKLGTDDVHRGDVLTRDGELPQPRRIDVTLSVVPGAEKELRDHAPVVVHIGTAKSGARLVRLADDLAHVALDEALGCEAGVGFVLRGFSTNRERGSVLGGGLVLDADADVLPRRREAEQIELRSKALGALGRRELSRALGAMIALTAPRALDAASAERRLGFSPEAVTESLAEIPGAVCVAEGCFTTQNAVDAIGRDAVRAVEKHHREHPHDLGTSVETLRAMLASKAGRNVADFVLQEALSKRKLVSLEQGVLAVPKFVQESEPALRTAARAVERVLTDAGLEGVNETDLVRNLGRSSEIVRAATARLSVEGTARRLGGLWFAEPALDDLRRRVGEYFAGRESMSVGEFKEVAGVSRKQAIPLLEQLDREGTTRRNGDARVAGARTK